MRLGAGDGRRATRSSRTLGPRRASARIAAGLSSSSYAVRSSTVAGYDSDANGYRGYSLAARSPSAPRVSLLIAGSIATDHLMTFGGQVRGLPGRRAAPQALGLLPGRRPRDPPRGSRRQHVLRPRAARAAPGAGRRRRRRLRRLPLAGSSGTASTATTCGSPTPTTPPGSCARPTPRAPVRVVLPRRDERGPAGRAGADRGQGRRPVVRPDRRRRPRGHAPAHRRVPPARLPVHRRPEPAAGVRRGRADPRPDRRRGVPVLQRVRVRT